MKHLFKLSLLALIIFTSCESHHDGDNDHEYSEEPAALDNPFIHSVYFWFKEGVTDEQLAAFRKDTEKLGDIESVQGLFWGEPAATDRPIVERSYDLAVIVHFEDLAGHDAYQQDPIHLKLLEDHADLWEKVMVTDVDPH